MMTYVGNDDLAGDAYADDSDYTDSDDANTRDDDESDYGDGDDAGDNDHDDNDGIDDVENGNASVVDDGTGTDYCNEHGADNDSSSCITVERLSLHV